MSVRHDNVAWKPRKMAPVFAALGDETRLALVQKLCDGSALSIARLTEGTEITRQGVTKHLWVLKEVGLVRGVRRGREQLFELEPEAIRDARAALEVISKQWDNALARLKTYVEKDPKRHSPQMNTDGPR